MQNFNFNNETLNSKNFFNIFYYFIDKLKSRLEANSNLYLDNYLIDNYYQKQNLGANLAKY